MKGLLVIIILGAIGWFAYQKYVGAAGGPVIEDPVYGEIRVTQQIQSREIEMALFIRAASDNDCRTRAQESWRGALQSCPGCVLQPVKCQKELPARYARLFEDVPIPSTYLSATAGTRGERDGRLVIYGLTDAEGVQLCEVARTQIATRYQGTMHCVKASGG